MTPAPRRRPPFEPAVAAELERMRADGTLVSVTADQIAGRRASAVPEDLSAFPVDRRDLTIAGYQGAALRVSVFTGSTVDGPAPVVLHFHGGGMMLGDRLAGMSAVLPWVVEHGAVAVTVDYRLAPEHPDPVPVEDCYAALLWVAGHAAELGADPDRIVLVGASAGGGLAAGTALLARDRGGPALLGQMLICPMLDDRDQTMSMRQFDGVGAWDRGSIRTGWTALLGDRRATGDVSIYAAPGRATGLAGLPATFIDVGSAEVFRDEDVAFATRIWADGGDAELHVWPGGTHGWDQLVPQSPMARQAVRTRDEWIARLLRR
ncbi:alpha/beta hydrolase [Dactylosporangium sp. NPDC000521]|uniref:alpha/beta hydrolase n=1 Tax=Dactylosporangium sp. NPDC000521 TaxID=3363975 RepID=UPI0036D118AD